MCNNTAHLVLMCIVMRPNKEVIVRHDDMPSPRDRQTDGRIAPSLNAPPRYGGGIICRIRARALPYRRRRRRSTARVYRCRCMVTATTVSRRGDPSVCLSVWRTRRASDYCCCCCCCRFQRSRRTLMLAGAAPRACVLDVLTRIFAVDASRKR